MTTAKTMSNRGDSHPSRPLRLWPGVVIVILQWLTRFLVPPLFPDATAIAVMGGLFGGLAVAVWWIFFSRAPRAERWLAVPMMILALLLTGQLVDVSLATGAMGMLLPIYAVPVLSLAFVAWAVMGRRLPTAQRWVTLVVTIVLASGVWTLVRTNGFTGGVDSDFAWRWSMTAEEKLVARAGEESFVLSPSGVEERAEPARSATASDASEGSDASDPGIAAGSRVATDSTLDPTDEAAPMPSEPSASSVDLSSDEPSGAPETSPAPPVASSGAEILALAEPEWPGFRGPDRDGDVAVPPIATDWSSVPPAELWRRPIGPGWSSFAVAGDRLYTQEQRGDDEVVSCYRLSTGEPVWRHHDPARFWESNAGAGPRGTPTLSDGRVYSLGATGILNALDAADGAVVWSRDAAADSGAKTPGWGFAGSPLVWEDLVIVATSGALVAYDRSDGEPRWFGPVGGEGYSSPQRMVIEGVEQILQLNGAGISSVRPADGEVLWEHGWEGYPIVQPGLTDDGDVLISVNAGSGTRRLAITHDAGGWAAAERWTSMGLKPYFNDFVVHRGHAYGFDGRILASIDLEDGERDWKGGRYGSGQLVLLPDQDLLLVLSEKGELALVSATPDGFTELARVAAVHGKTWNHPVVVGDILLVRNGEEMVAFRLPSEQSMVLAVVDNATVLQDHDPVDGGRGL
ncbi:MAG: PQQ-binding-like beta-propeller repeat protein [Thermoanaerobaculia bacterium]|nr:PQQ-binding-like beta-propeller repeat protein [Thermoanaerobaculia bacterium]